MRIATDTATLIVYDLTQLKHRINDEFEWWTDKGQEILEVNSGNALFIGLAEDGLYDIEVRGGAPIINDASKVVQARLHNTSGLFFIGPGESVTAENEEPVEGRYAHFYQVKPGDYEITVTGEDHSIFIWFSPINSFVQNNFTTSPLIGIRLAEEEHEMDSDENTTLENEIEMDKEKEKDQEQAKQESEVPEGKDFGDADPGLVMDEGLAEVVESICQHLEILAYELDDSEEDLLFFHEEYGYLLLEEYAGGIRFATTMEYDSQRDLKLMPYEEWRNRLLDVLDHFNASASVARAYDNPENEEVVLDTWYPAFYTKASFNSFIDLWHDDITVQFEEAQDEASEARVTH